jgi:hypothetical protein
LAVLETMTVTDVFCGVGGMLDMFMPQPVANAASKAALMAGKDLETRELDVAQKDEAGDFMYPPEKSNANSRNRKGGKRRRRSYC